MIAPDSASSRTLSKSDFTLARTCDAKLYFRENVYPDNRAYDPYLQFLAEGGYMVEALAKARYADGIQLEYRRNVHEDSARTMDALRQDRVTLFEATLLVGRRQARVDALVKDGTAIRLVEIKAKSFDAQDHLASLREGGKGAFRGKRKPHPIAATWRPKLEDVTYQVLLLEKLCPGATIHPFLALVDRSKHAAIDNIPSLFEMLYRDGPDGVRHLTTARYTGSLDLLPQLDLVTEVDVSEEVAMLRDEVEEAAARFERLLDEPLSAFMPTVERGSKCASCEFRSDTPGEKSGFDECWGPLAIGNPHFLELHAIGSAKGPDKTPLIDWMIKAGTPHLGDIPLDGLVKADGERGPQSDRQRRQITHTRSGSTFVDPGLRAKIESVCEPAHFIDFETSRLALPSHAQMRPYGVVTFQWSCHTVDAPGALPTHSEWLNTVDLWPNQTFAESLRAAIGDTGAVYTWSPFENSTLKQIIADLSAFGRHEPELVEWMRAIEGRIVDLHTWARDDYYHPAMGGRTSIKVVLDALWKSDPALRDQFEAWTGLTADGSTDPYQSLPTSMIDGVDREVREGTGAMRAYDAMMYGPNKHNPEITGQWAGLLRQYCKLDTLSMVLILEHWRRLVGLT